MIPAYQKHLTKGDGHALTAFYSAATGQKILKEMPALTAEAMQASSGIIQKMMAQVQGGVQSEIAQIQKENEGNAGKQPQSAAN